MNLNYERQDTGSSDARKSFDPSDKHEGTYRETWRGEIDFLQDLLHSAVQEHDHTCKQAGQKLMHQFESHVSKAALQEVLQQSRAFIPFSEKSEEMINSMGNMEYFDILRDHSKHTMLQLYDTLTERCYILHVRNIHSSDKVRKLNSDRHDVPSIPNIVMKKRTVPWETSREHRQRIYHLDHGSSRKATKED